MTTKIESIFSLTGVNLSIFIEEGVLRCRKPMVFGLMKYTLDFFDPLALEEAFKEV